MSQRPSGDYDSLTELTAAVQAEPEPAVKDLTSIPRRLSLSDIELMLRLKDEGLKQVEIAAILKCSQATVSATLSRLKNTPQLVQTLAQSEAVPMLNRWIRASKVAANRGDHRPAREFIELAAPELRPQPSNSSGGVGVTIVIGQPGSPVGLPTIDIKANALAPSPALALPRGETPEE
jgi:DNA-binding CsgD family transcriptional regulator